MCYRTCVSTSLAIACISKCILSMKYYSIKRCVEINLRIRHRLVLFPYRNQKFLSSSLIFTIIYTCDIFCSVVLSGISKKQVN